MVFGGEENTSDRLGLLENAKHKSPDAVEEIVVVGVSGSRSRGCRGMKARSQKELRLGGRGEHAQAPKSNNRGGTGNRCAWTKRVSSKPEPMQGEVATGSSRVDMKERW